MLHREGPTRRRRRALPLSLLSRSQARAIGIDGQFVLAQIDNVRIAEKPRDVFTIRVINPIEVPLQSLANYLNGLGVFHDGEKSEALQAVNVIFRHCPTFGQRAPNNPPPGFTLHATRSAFFPGVPSEVPSEVRVLQEKYLILIRALLWPSFPLPASTNLFGICRWLLCVSSLALALLPCCRD